MEWGAVAGTFQLPGVTVYFHVHHEDLSRKASVEILIHMSFCPLHNVQLLQRFVKVQMNCSISHTDTHYEVTYHQVVFSTLLTLDT